jgi:hypothetical protein
MRGDDGPKFVNLAYTVVLEIRIGDPTTCQRPEACIKAIGLRGHNDRITALRCSTNQRAAGQCGDRRADRPAWQPAGPSARFPAVRRMINLTLVKSVYAIPTWTRTVAVVRMLPTAHGRRALRHAAKRELIICPSCPRV